MIFKAKGIEFEPLSWDFVCDGMWGKIYFLVPKGTFNPGTNNGAYALDDFPSSIISRFPNIEQDKHQLVHAATSCMVIGKDGEGDYCERYKLKDILQAAADFISHNLTVADNTHRYRTIKRLSNQ